MDKVVYTSMGGARIALRAQGINSHNLANINTPGFRATLTAAQPAEHEPSAARVDVRRTADSFDTRTGPIETTGRELDVAVLGQGWLAVEDARGNEAYTRAGNFRLDPDGTMRTGSGDYVLDEGGARIIVPPTSSLTISANGDISIVPAGQGVEATARIATIKRGNPDPLTMQRGVDGLFRLQGGAVAPADATVRLQSGALEGSNVNAAEVLVKMIELSRTFDMQMRTIKSVDENSRSAQNLLSIG